MNSLNDAPFARLLMISEFVGWPCVRPRFINAAFDRTDDRKKRHDMFASKPVSSTKGKMTGRKELRLHLWDEMRIMAAAAETGLKEADFIRQAALLRAEEVERRMSLSLLPAGVFEAFKAAFNAPGEIVPGHVTAAKSSEGLLKDAEQH